MPAAHFTITPRPSMHLWRPAWCCSGRSSTRQTLVIRWSRCLLLLSLLTTCTPLNKTCNQTLWDALVANTNTYHALLQLKSNEFGTVPYLNNTSNIATVLAPTDTAMLTALRNISGSSEDADALLQVLSANSSTYNAVALFNLLPGGAWSKEWLVNLGYDRTGLQVATGDNYTMRFGKTNNRTWAMTPWGNRGRIVNSIPTCNGYVHLMDTLLLPAESPRLVPLIDAVWTEQLPNALDEDCEPDWLSRLVSIPSVARSVEALSILAPSMNALLNATPAGRTIFLPDPESSEQLLTSPDGKALSADPAMFLAHSMLSNPLCPQELVTMSPIQTVLGSDMNHTLPLFFYLNANGTIDIAAADVEGWTANILQMHQVCDSMVYLYKGVPKMHTDSEHMHNHQLPDRTTMTVLPVYNSTDATQLDRCAYPLNDASLPGFSTYLNAERVVAVLKPQAPAPAPSSSNTGTLLAILLPSILGAVLLTALIVGAAMYWHARRRRRRERAMHVASFKYNDEEGANTEDLMNRIAEAASGQDFLRLASWKDRKLAKKSRSNGQQSAVRGSDTPSTDTCGVATPNLTPASSWQQPATTAGQGSTSNGHANPAPNQPWEIEPEELEIVQDGENKPIVLGAGGCGEVLRGVRGGVQDVAIKVLCGNAAQGPGDALVKEIQVLKDLRDRNVVQFYGAVIREGRMMLVTEYMPGGDLLRALKAARERGETSASSSLGWYARGQHIALDIARGLAYLHSRRVVHLDLKSANILLSEDGNVAKIGDMGLAQVAQAGGVEEEVSSSSGQGTYAWAAPELLANTRLTSKADMYSFGVICYELVTLEFPARGRMRSVRYVCWGDAVGVGVVERVPLHTTNHRVPEECPELIRDLICACLKTSVNDRPTAKEAFAVIKQCLSSRAPASS